ncbi:hypothetical protein QAD02_018759 [Eretmocerus hayati]|uniref:Uncharacterized protein n=1 Tax=Eretmocerus hayati TaxID=131215 RepID=A0ACC2PHM5_9HYME|nr:hypothetical protein QAD02_018759 [Eretmocerus hayati]
MAQQQPKTNNHGPLFNSGPIAASQNLFHGGLPPAAGAGQQPIPLTPSKRKRPSKVQTSHDDVQFPLQNRFDALIDSEESDLDDGTAAQSNNKKQRTARGNKERIPPIIITTKLKTS